MTNFDSIRIHPPKQNITNHLCRIIGHAVMSALADEEFIEIVKSDIESDEPEALKPFIIGVRFHELIQAYLKADVDDRRIKYFNGTN